MSIVSKRDRILGGLWGSVVGDALGVPIEFRTLEEIQSNPVTDMRAFGSHHQPKGTWPDDTSLSLCTAESLLGGFNTSDLGQRFVAWLNEDKRTPWGDVFDAGLTTTDAILRSAKGASAEQAGGTDQFNNGNGSLMRMLPAALRVPGRFQPVRAVLYARPAACST